MKDGFIRAAAVTPKIRVADPEYNVEQCIELGRSAAAKGASIVAFPELVISGYTCQDLFLDRTLIGGCLKALSTFAKETAGENALFFLGLPMESEGKLYSCGAAVSKGRVLGVVPKIYLPNYGEFYEARHFYPGSTCEGEIGLGDGERVPFSANLLFRRRGGEPLTVGVEICEDLWTPDPPSVSHAMAGANLMVNLSAGNEVVTKDSYRRTLVSSTSARLLCAYVYAAAGDGESTQDLVFSGHDIIAENGQVLAESKLFSTGVIFGDIDLQKLAHERRRMTTFDITGCDDHFVIDFDLDDKDLELTRTYSPAPFVPAGKDEKDRRCDEILTIQALGLKKRLETVGAKNAVMGLSGGLDSTLALLVTVRAFDMLSLDRKGIECITMPCFGTTDRTYNNACSLAKAVGSSLLEIDIANAVRVHFADIGQSESVHDVTYENCQARERTQVLMDVANKDGALVVGTGDMSELALGWATYNGDHMSMYGVNAGVPKTLVRHLVNYHALTCGDEKVKAVLLDVLDTPVSPELIPPENGVISQKTEEIVGPYELHDFFLYHVLRSGFSPAKIYRIALLSFEGVYDRATILKWEKIFFSRFFSQQFKRSCLPDGPKVGSVALSPRGDWRMPSDASSRLWLEELAEIEKTL